MERTAVLRRPWPQPTYWCAASSCSMRARVSSATSSRPFTTLETVGSDTPASRATAASVARLPSALGIHTSQCCETWCPVYRAGQRYQHYRSTGDLPTITSAALSATEPLDGRNGQTYRHITRHSYGYVSQSLEVPDEQTSAPRSRQTGDRGRGGARGWRCGGSLRHSRTQPGNRHRRRRDDRLGPDRGLAVDVRVLAEGVGRRSPERGDQLPVLLERRLQAEDPGRHR